MVQGESYHELGADYLERRNAEGRIRYLRRHLEKRNVRMAVEPMNEAT